MKRFTDTSKWGKVWFQELPPHLKCFWFFLCDNVDSAGVWEPNFKLASFQIGKTISESDLSHFEGRVGKMKNGRWAILSFVEFQYGTLSRDCKAHIPVFRMIEKHNLPDSLSIPYPRAMDSHKEEEEEKEEETDTEKEGGDARGGFDEFWQAYPLRAGKGKAREAWVKRNCEPMLPKILTAIRALKISRQWTDEGGKYIPMPATWLNREGWHDELPARNGNPSTSIREDIRPPIFEP